MRTSAMHHLHASRVPEWTERSGMRVPQGYGGEGAAAPIRIADLSCLVRAGVKGPGAAAWLGARELPVPRRANGWCAAPDGALIARLGETEFFLEDADAEGAASRALQALGHDAVGVYPVLRQDTALALWGARANEAMLETCSVDFDAIDTRAHELAMTSMAGVSVLVVPRMAGSLRGFRIWVDPSFGPYLWRTLLAVVEDLGGGPAGYAAFSAARFIWTD